ncbi:MAG TPA: hypothetical protein VIZ18_07380, partial [Ktedonobacteraceae bacterium]
VGSRDANRSPPHEDRHKAPTHPRIHPLSLQDGSAISCGYADSVVKLHQDARAAYGLPIPGFGR